MPDRTAATVAVVVTAAGSGRRLGRTVPKALVPLHGVPLVVRAVRALVAGVREHGDEPVVVVTAPETHLAEVAALVEGDRPGCPVAVVRGGAARQASVAAALTALRDLPGEADVVLVHDAARPSVPAGVVGRVLDALRAGRRAVVPGVPVADTIKRVGPGAEAEPVVETLERGTLRAVQTPQGFDRLLLERAHALAAEHADDETRAASDDAGLVERLGEPVWVVPGDEAAAKITTERDLHVAELLTPGHATPALPRTGIGVDVHAYASSPTPDAVLHLAGLAWPGERPLAGHSDADVAAHAAADALLVAAGLGDLGSNFGTSDPRWAGAAGTALLAEAAARVRAAGFVIGNVAVQVVANRPRIGARRAEAQAALSAAAGAPVTVAATTSDGLGLTGRGEGVAGIATAVVLAVG